MTELPKRKRNRLQDYDYSKNGAYFVTICAKDRVEIFGSVVGAVANRPPCVELSDIGEIIDKEIHVMQEIRKNVFVDRYVIMPNHVHLIISIAVADGRLTTAPTTVSGIIRQWKRSISKQIGFSPWQRSFHDRIIRDEREYMKIAQYIDNNPAKWTEDCFYSSK